MPGPKISKMVTHRQKRFATLTTMAQLSRGDLIEALNQAPTEGDGQVLGEEAAVYLDALMARLTVTHDGLIQAERRHLDALAPDALLRSRQRVATNVVRDELFHLRDLCRGAFGREKAVQLAFERRLAKDPTPLLRQGLRVESRLRDPDLILTPRRPSIHIDRDALADDLQDLLRELREAIDGVTDKLARIQRTKTTKDRAISLFDKTYQTTSTGLAGALRLAGKHEIADRVPISPRPRPRGKSEDKIAANDLVSSFPADAG